MMKRTFLGLSASALRLLVNTTVKTTVTNTAIVKMRSGLINCIHFFRMPCDLIVMNIRYLDYQSDINQKHFLYIMCDNIEVSVAIIVVFYWTIYCITFVEFHMQKPILEERMLI